MKNIILLLCVITAWRFYTYTGEVTLGPGVLAKEAPNQTTVKSSINHQVDDYVITELEKFNIKAKVLSKKNYYTGRESGLSPTDLALGWGRMSDESILDQIDISQSGRWYRWKVDAFPIPRKEIETHSANMHLIPANDLVGRSIKKIKNGDIIQLSGSLVKVKASDGWNWKSSLTRTDTGAHACELIWVESLYIVTP